MFTTSTHRRFGRVATLLALVLVATLGLSASKASAGTTCTIYNASPFPIRLDMKWSHLQAGSGVLVLPPGQAIHPWVPQNNVQLWLRFEETPIDTDNQPHLVAGLVLTTTNVGHWVTGEVSCFYSPNPNMPDFVRFTNINANNGMVMSPVLQSIQFQKPAGMISGQDIGAVEGAIIAAGLTEGDPQAALAGAQIGHVIGGGTPAIKQAVANALGF